MRAKRTIADAGIPHELPSPEFAPERFEAALAVAYLVFDEGCSASQGDTLVRADLAKEAIRLGRPLAEVERR